MPNWVSTTLSVKGSESEVKRFIDGIKDNEILKSYFPCPDELDNTMSGFHTDEEKQEALRKKREENVAKYGYGDWYEWQYGVWGTKWGDCDTRIEPLTELADGSAEVQGYFQTAWGTAENGFRKVSALFPTLTFLFDYDEEAGFFAGLHAIKDGEIVFESLFEPCAYEGEIDWDDYESIDKYEAWKEKNSDDIFAQYCEFLKKASLL